MSNESRGSSSSLSQFDTFSTQAGRLNNLFGDSTTGLSPTLQKFVNSHPGGCGFPDVDTSPSDLAQPGAVRGRATQELRCTRLRSFEREVNTAGRKRSGRDHHARDGHRQVEPGSHRQAIARSGQPPNDLMDQRDQLIDQLRDAYPSMSSSRMAVVNVFIGNGQPLVLGQTAGQVVVDAGSVRSDAQLLGVQDGERYGRRCRSNISGGTLGGMLQFRNAMLDPAHNALGRMSVGLAQVVNEQHRAGIDLNGQLGGDFFASAKRGYCRALATPARVLSALRASTVRQAR